MRLRNSNVRDKLQNSSLQNLQSESMNALFTRSKFALLTNIYYAHICKGNTFILQQLGKRVNGSGVAR